MPPLRVPPHRPATPSDRLSVRGIGPTALVMLAFALTACQQDSDTRTGTEPVPVGAADVTAPLSFRQVAAGFDRTCGVTTDNLGYCWGSTSGPRPVRVTGGLKFLEIRVGETHACGLTTDSLAYCWGSNEWGQFGNGTTDPVLQLTPTPVSGGRRWRQISPGSNYTCGITVGGVSFCWGRNRWLNLGIGSFTGSTLVPIRVAGNLKFRRLGAAFSATCGATTSDRAYCWGFGWGDAPVPVPGGLSFRQALAGSGYILRTGGDQVPEAINDCGVTAGARLYCWTGRSANPYSISAAQNWLYVNPGGYHTCALTLAGAAYCMGSNNDGQLGIGSRTGTSILTPVAGGRTYRGLSAAVIGFYTCGVTTGNRAFCWGDNSYGQLGDGTQGTDRLTPVAVVGP